MSLLENIKKGSITTEELFTDQPKIVIVSDNFLTAENYTCIKLFGENAMILAFEDFDLYIEGKNLFIESFSPARIALWGSIKSLSYASKKISVEET